jgi:flagellar biosynthesis protein FliR
MSRFVSAALSFLLAFSTSVFAQSGDVSSAPSETVSTVYVVVFAVIFIGMIVGFFIYLFMTDKKPEDSK